MTDDRCRGLISQLRADGSLDWQLLLVLLNVVAQWQVEHSVPAPVGPDMLGRSVNARIFRGERANDPQFDLDALTEERIRLHQRVLVPAAFKVWGLECHRTTPNFDAMKRLLDARYGHSTDDIPHEDPFPQLRHT